MISCRGTLIRGTLNVWGWGCVLISCVYFNRSTTDRRIPATTSKKSANGFDCHRAATVPSGSTHMHQEYRHRRVLAVGLLRPLNTTFGPNILYGRLGV